MEEKNIKKPEPKSAARKMPLFFRAFTLTLLAVLLPALLITGISRADENTRATGFTDREPVFGADENAAGDVTITAFGYHLTLDSGILGAAEQAVSFAGRLLPKGVTLLAWLLQNLPAAALALTG